jgi:hypothetical protein
VAIFAEREAAIWETAGGKNLFLPIDFLHSFLDALDDATLEAVTEGRRHATTKPGQLCQSGIVSERQLQDLLVQQILAQEHFDVFGRVQRIQVNPVWVRLCSGELIGSGRDIPDLVVETADQVFIVELKKAGIGYAEIHQLHRYLANPSLLSLAGHRPITGILIGDRVDSEITGRDLVSPHAPSGKVSVLRYRYEHKVVLEPWSG